MNDNNNDNNNNDDNMILKIIIMTKILTIDHRHYDSHWFTNKWLIRAVLCVITARQDPRNNPFFELI